LEEIDCININIDLKDTEFKKLNNEIKTTQQINNQLITSNNSSKLKIEHNDLIDLTNNENNQQLLNDKNDNYDNQIEDSSNNLDFNNTNYLIVTEENIQNDIDT
jgi:hypothetical protein